jgi:mannose-6-phosphate isomerase
VEPGDCYVVPAGTPHAIGAGVFMMELMEPTDWAVRCETVNAGVTLPPEACFMGLGLEACLDIFDYRAHPLDAVRENFQQHTRVLRETAGCIETEVIGSAWHRYFRLHRINGNGDGDWVGNELMLAIVTKGQGRLSGGSNACQARAGQTWLLPGAAPHWRWQNESVEWEILLAKLPRRPDSSSVSNSNPGQMRSPAQH